MNKANKKSDANFFCYTCQITPYTIYNCIIINRCVSQIRIKELLQKLAIFTLKNVKRNNLLAHRQNFFKRKLQIKLCFKSVLYFAVCHRGVFRIIPVTCLQINHIVFAVYALDFFNVVFGLRLRISVFIIFFSCRLFVHIGDLLSILLAKIVYYI